jgi:hypothetical protein
MDFCDEEKNNRENGHSYCQSGSDEPMQLEMSWQ